MDESTPEVSQLYQRAIHAAMDLRWEDAIKLNRQIIKLEPQNIDALNRQAKAYLELGKFNMAKKYYTEALKFDPYNPIALKNLKIIKSFKFKNQGDAGQINCASLLTGQRKLSPSLFLQEPGKTKLVNLLKVAEPQKLSHIYCGMMVEAVIKNRKIMVADSNGEYLGVLPDDVSHHLTRLMRGGNKYELFIKSIKVNGLSVLIRETFRSKKFRNQPSFLENSQQGSYTEMFTPLDMDESEEESVDENEPAT